MFDQVLGGVPTPLKLFLALAAVIALIVIAAWLTKRFGGQRLGSVAMAGRSRQPRLGVLDVLAVDGRRRLVIVRRDNVEHLVMIGGPNDLVVESGILRVPAGGALAPQREATGTPVPEAIAPRPVPQPQPAPSPRAAPPVPVAPPQPLRPVEQPQPVRAPRSVEAPPIVPSPSVTSAPFTPSPPSKGPAAPKPAPLPAAPTIPTVAPSAVSQTSPAPAAPPAQVKPAPLKPVAEPVPSPTTSEPAAIAPAPAQASAQIATAPIARAQAAPAAAGPARVSQIASPSDIAERLAAALKRPVAPQNRSPERAKIEPAKPEPAVILAADKPDTEAGAPAIAEKDGDHDIPDVIAPAQDPDEASAPEVKPEPRPALAEAGAPAPDDDDPFSLEADLAALLGRDMSRSKS